MLAKRGGKYLVRYIDFSRSSDEWVSPDRIKPRGAPAPKAPAPPAPVAGSGGKIDGLYYRTVVVDKKISGNVPSALRTYPFWFLPNGNVLGGSWDAIIAYLAGGLEHYKREQAQFWGTYQLDGGTIVVTWSGGREERFETESAGSGVKIKGLNRAYPLKSGIRLDGTYLLRNNKNGTFGTKSYVFRPDMTVRYNHSETKANINERPDGTEIGRNITGGEAMRQGTYTIDGYTLQIKYEFGNHGVAIWLFDGDDAASDAPRMICIGNDVFQRQP